MSEAGQQAEEVAQEATDTDQEAPLASVEEALAAKIWHALNAAYRIDRDAAIKTACHWLDYWGAQSPQVSLFQDRVRDDARFWADCATDIEVEAYLVAALHRVEREGLAERATKRLAAASYARLSSDARTAFLAWAKKQGENENE